MTPLMPHHGAACSDLPRATTVARTLFFAPMLTGLADRIVAGMTAAGAAPFNSLHLRIEKDAKDWSTIMGGAGVGIQPQQNPYAAAVLPVFGSVLRATEV